MKKITRRSFMAAAGLTVAALALTACGGSSSTASSAAASSVASSAAASSEAASAAATELTTVEAGKLTMATNAAFPPYEMTTDAGEFEGIDIETAQAIADKLGLELQIDDMDFDAALHRWSSRTEGRLRWWPWSACRPQRWSARQRQRWWKQLQKKQQSLPRRKRCLRKNHRRRSEPERQRTDRQLPESCDERSFSYSNTPQMYCMFLRYAGTMRFIEHLANEFSIDCTN